MSYQDTPEYRLAATRHYWQMLLRSIEPQVRDLDSLARAGVRGAKAAHLEALLAEGRLLAVVGALKAAADVKEGVIGATDG